MTETQKGILFAAAVVAFCAFASFVAVNAIEHDRAKWRAVVERCEKSPGCKLTPYDYRRAGMHRDE